MLLLPFSYGRRRRLSLHEFMSAANAPKNGRRRRRGCYGWYGGRRKAKLQIDGRQGGRTDGRKERNKEGPIPQK